MKRFKFERIAINSTEKKKPVESDKTTYLGLEHLDGGSLQVSRFGAETAPIGEKLVMKKGDVLFGKRRAYQKKVAIAPFDGIFSAHGMVLRPQESVISKRLFPFFISSDTFLDAAIKISVGSLSPTVNWSALKELEFNIPSLNEQEALADLFWKLETVKNAYNRLLRETEQLVKSRFIEMFGDPNRGVALNFLTDGFDIRDDLRKPLNDVERSNMKDGQLYPYYGANGLVDKINKYMLDDTALCLAEDCGSYAAGEYSSYIIRGKSWINNHAHVLFPKGNCNVVYANVYFCLLDISSCIAGTTRAKLTQEQMRILPIILPPLSLQQEFAAFVESVDKSKFALLAGCQRSINTLIRLEKAVK